MMMTEAKKKDLSHWWWFDNHSKGSPNRSPWLQTTLSELDEKTRAMLQVIEEDADSFAQRAEMYYKKRPQLMSMVEDLYRTHRSLAERYDQVKSEHGSRLPSSPWSSSPSPLPFTRYRLEKSLSLTEGAYDSYSEAYGPDESDESEVDDPDEAEEVVVGSDVPNVVPDEEELVRLREEVMRLVEENAEQREQLKAKDEEKREVIRQLSRGMELLREENVMLRERLSKKTPKKENQVEYSKMKENFFERLFNGFGKPPVIAL
ncbi:protein NETWORKED 3C-like [Salvia miltiorrhiza]|uniref:protein NETWORKED 3C-like n=1 Tax=Salvia miltiorrhiza TaxID=226208 RepID=UPI0025AC6901|nr:protein NETWORKED 3C-like [Salvia miltiorrhiza]XP_057782420.1 protein NETWORKED 3C-like [Salvia miltiorrhiza]XP_057782421.1 protein NETWORKED 3C-like [Salvia miltiorrhiza]